MQFSPQKFFHFPTSSEVARELFATQVCSVKAPLTFFHADN